MRVAIQNAILIGLIILILSYVVRNARAPTTTTTEAFPKGAPLAWSAPDPEPRPKPAHELELFQWAYNNDQEPVKNPANAQDGIQGFDASEVSWSQV